MPQFGITDIFGYLVCGVSAYTSEQFQSYESLESHVQFTNGWVQELHIRKPANSGYTVLWTKLLHSAHQWDFSKAMGHHYQRWPGLLCTLYMHGWHSRVMYTFWGSVIQDWGSTPIPRKKDSDHWSRWLLVLWCMSVVTQLSKDIYCILYIHILYRYLFIYNMDRNNKRIFVIIT